MTLNFGNNLFPPRQELLQSYDWIDLITEQGYGTFYLAKAHTSDGTETSFITSTEIESYPTLSSVSAGGDNADAYAIKVNDDFDLLVNSPLTINGKVIIVLSLYTTYTTDNFNAYWQVRLRKWDGTTETEIGAAKTELVLAVGNNTRRRTFEIDVTKEQYKKGEYIRITVEGWVAKSDNTGSQIGYWHDPASKSNLSRSYNNPTATGDIIEYGENTDAKILIPFKINI